MRAICETQMRTRYWRSTLLAFIVTMAIGPGCGGAHRAGATDGGEPRPVPRDSTRLFRDDAALFAYVKQYGLADTIARLHHLSSSLGDCHQPAHKAGRFAYDIY